MAISNLERRIRFSNEYSVQEYRDISQEYRNKVFPMLLENIQFRSILESTGDGSEFIWPKAKLEKEAKRLIDTKIVYYVNLGTTVITFLMEINVYNLSQILTAIKSLLTIRGEYFNDVFNFLIGVIFYAITEISSADLTRVFRLYEDQLYDEFSNEIYNKSSAKIKLFRRLVSDIAYHEHRDGGIPSIHQFAKLIAISGAVNDFIANYQHPDSNYEVDSFDDCCSILTAIDSRLSSKNSDDFTKMDMKLFTLGEIAPEDRTYNPNSNSLMESVELLADRDNDYTPIVILESILDKPMLSTRGLFHGIISIITEQYNPEIYKKFFDCYQNTARYEFTHESYKDFPLGKATSAILEYAKGRCKGNKILLENIETLENAFDSANELVYDEVKEEAEAGGAPCCSPSMSECGFNPDPFSLGSLTPFDVANRQVGSTLYDIVRAEDDDQLTEAFLDMGRLETIINESYSVEGNAKDGYWIMENAGSLARRVGDKANQKFSKIATKDKTSGIKAAIKRAIDPMEKFIEQKWDEFKEKDAAERREIILKGGVGPKVMRWIKRGIKLLIGGMVGTIIPPVAIISGIVFIGRICTDKYLDGKERAKILRELEDEIMICNEKIEDSRGDDDKQKKYELMRIRNQLQRTSEKIRLGLRY